MQLKISLTKLQREFNKIKNDQNKNKITNIKEEEKKENIEDKDNKEKNEEKENKENKENKEEKEEKEIIEDLDLNLIKNENINEIEFKRNPESLKEVSVIDETNKKTGRTDPQEFEVYIGLIDKIEYIAYNRFKDLIIRRIKDKKIILFSSKDNNYTISTIKYYLKDDTEEYLLTCDKKGKAIIWDIQNNYRKKILLLTNSLGPILNCFLLFKELDEKYLIMTSSNPEELTKLYKFKNKYPKFIKYID